MEHNISKINTDNIFEVINISKASAYFSIDNINSKRDIKELKRELDTLRGVISVSVSDNNDIVAVDFDNSGVASQQIQKKIEKLGYNIKQSKEETHIM